MSRDVHNCNHWLRPRNPPPPIPPHCELGLVYEGARLVSKYRRHLFVTPCCNLLNAKTVSRETVCLKQMPYLGLEPLVQNIEHLTAQVEEKEGQGPLTHPYAPPLCNSS
jgi:hypothetical protein